jgi:hypothetical protein
VALEDRQERRVLARVVRVRRRGVDAVVGGEHEQVPGAQEVEPAGHRLVDALQRPVEAVDVLAVAVALVGLDEVREDEAAVQLAADEPVVSASAAAFEAPGWRAVKPTPAKRSCVLPTAWTGIPRPESSSR